MDIEKFKKWAESEEGQKSINDYWSDIDKKNQILDSQLVRFHNKGGFSEFIEKVLAKYNSNKYRDRWYNRGREPREDLLWFLYHYSEKYGRICTEEEMDTYSNMFTSDLLFCNGYYFNRIDGQGSAIIVTKK